MQTAAFSAAATKTPVATTKAVVPRVSNSKAPAPIAAKPSISNARSSRQIQTWIPDDNKMFETLSYLPALTDDQIARQVDYITGNGWTPCLEFAARDKAYVSSENTIRFGPVSSNYYDNRYWTMWKLPMFGCTDSSQVLREITLCKNAFPDAYVRCVAFDSVRQVQMVGFLVHRPTSATDYISDPSKRSK